MLMDSDIKRLLERYWECETSLEEEQELRDYFNKNEVPEDWKETALLFKYFDSQKNWPQKKQDLTPRQGAMCLPTGARW